MSTGRDELLLVPGWRGSYVERPNTDEQDLIPTGGPGARQIDEFREDFLVLELVVVLEVLGKTKPSSVVARLIARNVRGLWAKLALEDSGSTELAEVLSA
jgi:hypothetical protein